MRRELLWPILLILASSCVTIQEKLMCAPAGKFSAGGFCSHMISDTTFDLTFEELVDLLEAQPKRTCVPVPGAPICSHDQTTGTPVELPERAASIIMPAEDWDKMKTELEVSCRLLGPQCSKETQKLLQKMQ